ncbi:PcfJ domain-containing protein [Aureisphaera galaxeae]|uniref:PcfJ domain-containing protein n=1 Tax=Aureisphaera galaxeae TaxID=1538023 RepID=UPI00235014A4|nr:PcfJ domain-containing protein [Aureisphaera galaxeae]MDC8004261.1 PcfJ domain-containing protein [Aureisphaera galaxeae]
MKTNELLQQQKLKYSNYKKLVERIYNEDNKPMHYKGTIESMLREFFSKTSKYKYTWKRNVFKDLLIHLYNEKCYALLRNYNHVAVLHNISSFGNKLVRPIEDWKKPSSHQNEQLSSLIQHCFAKYETPEFLEASFYSAEKRNMLWYVQLGKGKSVKDLSQMPIQLTHKMAHAFRNAPSFLSITEALRYAQAVGFGASTKTAKLIAISRLSIIREEQEPFWATVVRFFAKEEDLNVRDVDLMVDYLTFKYREDNSFSMKNRTVNALLQQTHEWHRDVHLRKRENFLTWSRTGIKPLYVEEFVDDKKVVFKTVELLNSAELYDEGNEMQHCVAEYDTDCHDGEAAIFSLQKEVAGEPVKRLATLEVSLPEYELVQAKAKYNAEPDRKSQELLNLWMEQTQVKRKNEVGYEAPYQAQAQMVNVAHRRARNNDNDIEIGWIVRIVLWIGYLIMKALMSN